MATDTTNSKINVKAGTITTIIMMVLMALGITFLGIDNGKKADKILDLEAELKTANGYALRVEHMDGFAINEALRVSGSDKILEVIQKQDPQAFAKLIEHWADLRPVVYQKIYIDRQRTDTLLIAKTTIKHDTLEVTFNWENQSLIINGKTYLIPDTIAQEYSSYTRLNVERKPLKFIITVSEDAAGNLKTVILSSDTTIQISELDTRLAKNFTLKKDMYFMIGGSLGTALHEIQPKMSVYTGLDFVKNNWSMFLRLDIMEQKRIFEAVSVGYIKKF